MKRTVPPSKLHLTWHDRPGASTQGFPRGRGSDDLQIVRQSRNRCDALHSQHVPAAEIEHHRPGRDLCVSRKDLAHRQGLPRKQGVVDPQCIGIVLKIDDHVLSAVKDKDIRPPATGHHVMARAARQDIIAVLATKPVVAGQARQPVRPPAARQAVVARSAVKRVVAVPPGKAVVAALATDPVASGIARHPVRAAPGDIILDHRPLGDRQIALLAKHIRIGPG